MPRPSDFRLLFQKKALSPVTFEPDDQNDTCPATPDPVTAPPPVEISSPQIMLPPVVVVSFPPLVFPVQFKLRVMPDAETTPEKVEVALPMTAKLVVVALVEVEFTVIRFVIVDVELFTRIPPERVPRPEAVSVEREDSPMTERLPPIDPLFETVSCEVEAFPLTERNVVVAFVVVPLTMERLVIVEVLEFTRMPPSKVASPLTFIVEVAVTAPPKNAEPLVY